MSKYYDERTNPNALNIYVCTECGLHIVTKDVVDGVTPFIIGCKCTARCTGHMQSSMYRVFDPEGNMRWEYEWYKPVIMNPTWNAGIIDHIQRGGLMLRRRLDNPQAREVGAFTHRHKKRGENVRIIAEGHLQLSTTGIADGVAMTFYQAEDGSFWCRMTDEFNDGRFEELPHAERS